jgi:CRP/FNR family transcriptional regulator, cyclic AMP receptor protein
MTQDPDRSIILKQYSLFSDLTEEEYEQLDVADNFKEVAKDEYIYFEAFNHNNIYFIKTGHIRLGQLDEAGNRLIKDVLHPGDFFGQISLVRENLNGEFAQAMKSDVSLCSFTLDRFNSLLKIKPQLAIKFSKLVGFRMKRFENRLLNILQKDAKTRLQLFLQQLLQDAREVKRIGPQELQIPNYLTHEEIAQLIGTSRQTVTTLFNELKDEGICSYSRKELRFYHFKGPAPENLIFS